MRACMSVCMCPYVRTSYSVRLSAAFVRIEEARPHPRLFKLFNTPCSAAACRCRLLSLPVLIGRRLLLQRQTVLSDTQMLLSRARQVNSPVVCLCHRPKAGGEEFRCINTIICIPCFRLVFLHSQFRISAYAVRGGDWKLRNAI